MLQLDKTETTIQHLLAEWRLRVPSSERMKTQTTSYYQLYWLQKISHFSWICSQHFDIYTLLVTHSSGLTWTMPVLKSDMSHVVLVQRNSQSDGLRPTRRIVMINHHRMVLAVPFYTWCTEETILERKRKKKLIKLWTIPARLYFTVFTYVNQISVVVYH